MSLTDLVVTASNMAGESEIASVTMNGRNHCVCVCELKTCFTAYF